MSIIKAIKLKRSLTPKQKEFLSTKSLEGNFTPQKLLKSLTKVAKFDQLNDKSRTPLIVFSILSLIAGIILAIVISNAIPFIIGIIAFIIPLIMYTNLKGLDLNNNFREFTIPLIGLLREEVKPNSKMKITLSCKDPFNYEYKYDFKPRTSSLGREISFYKYPWLNIKTELIDNSILAIDNTVFLQKIDIKKRGASGKIKYKTKYKGMTVLTIIAEFPKSKYNLVNRPEDSMRINNSGDNIMVKNKIKIKTPNKNTGYSTNYLINNIQKVFSVVEPIKS